MSLFKRGYKALQEEEQRRKEYNSNKSSIYRLYIKEGEAGIVFLTEEPVNFYEHNVKNTRNGKEYFDSVTCTGSDCPVCDSGDRPSFKSAWLVLDLRPYEYEDKKTGKTKTLDKQIKVYVAGTKVAGVIQRKSERYGLLHTEYLLERIGKKTDTTYTLDKEGKFKITKKEIEELLPEIYREMYDGSEDSLMDIIEAEISKSVSQENGKNKDDYDDADDEDDNGAILGVDDDEEEETPKKKSSSISTKGTKKKFKFNKK